jgi:hypothetical protein
LLSHAMRVTQQVCQAWTAIRGFALCIDSTGLEMPGHIRSAFARSGTCAEENHPTQQCARENTAGHDPPRSVNLAPRFTGMNRMEGMHGMDNGDVERTGCCAGFRNPAPTGNIITRIHTMHRNWGKSGVPLSPPN